MSWIGVWRNQYDSIVEITDDADGRIRGVFKTALEESGFYGQDAPIFGAHRGDCIGFSCVCTGPSGDMVVSYTGLLRDGKLETLWHFVGDSAATSPPQGASAALKKQDWWKATLTSADTFVRIG